METDQERGHWLVDKDQYFRSLAQQRRPEEGIRHPRAKSMNQGHSLADNKAQAIAALDASDPYYLEKVREIKERLEKDEIRATRRDIDFIRKHHEQQAGANRMRPSSLDPLHKRGSLKTKVIGTLSSSSCSSSSRSSSCSGSSCSSRSSKSSSSRSSKSSRSSASSDLDRILDPRKQKKNDKKI